MTERPQEIVQWRQIEAPEAFIYDGFDERMCLDANFSRHFRFARLGIQFCGTQSRAFGGRDILRLDQRTR